MFDRFYRRDLGGGLVLRWSRPDDVEDIVYLVSSVFRPKEDAPLNTHMGDLMKEMLSGKFPVMASSDVVVVEDTHRKEHPLVASTCLWHQTWEYEGIPFEIGRPEIVATDPDYRNRGLIRAIFELIHARSEADGHLVQGITGISYFYRQFGYEYALDLDVNRATHFSLIPEAKEGEPEACTLRDATLEDLPLIVGLYNRQQTAYPVSTQFDEQWWRYQIQTWNGAVADGHWHIFMLLDVEGKTQGYLTLPMIRWRQSVPVFDLCFAPGVNIQTLMPALLRAIRAQGEHMITPPHVKAATRIMFTLGQKHPAYDVLGKDLAVEQSPPYAWYVRVPNLPRFMWHIASALEKRLANSVVAGYSGEILFNFYRGGLRLAFDHGRLTIAEDWRAPQWEEIEHAGFPPLVFLQMLFGRRSLDDLRYALPDVFANSEIELVLKTLFPASPSWVLPLG